MAWGLDMCYKISSGFPASVLNHSLQQKWYKFAVPNPQLLCFSEEPVQNRETDLLLLL